MFFGRQRIGERLRQLAFGLLFFGEFFAELPGLVQGNVFDRTEVAFEFGGVLFHDLFKIALGYFIAADPIAFRHPDHDHAESVGDRLLLFEHRQQFGFGVLRSGDRGFRLWLRAFLFYLRRILFGRFGRSRIGFCVVRGGGRDERGAEQQYQERKPYDAKFCPFHDDHF